jgi:chromosome segregation ATPase
VTHSETEERLRQIEEHLRQATTRMTDAATRLATAEEQLAAVEEQRHTLAGQTAINRRAVADYQELIEKLRGELAALHVEQAHEAFEKAVQARDHAVREAASALERITTALEQLDTRRTVVARAEQELRAIDAEASVSIPPEPDVLDAAWEEILPLLRARLNERLEADLIEAAVVSVGGRAIEQLPEHLRELARQRRNQRVRETFRKAQR